MDGPIVGRTNELTDGRLSPTHFTRINRRITDYPDQCPVSSYDVSKKTQKYENINGRTNGWTDGRTDIADIFYEAITDELKITE